MPLDISEYSSLSKDHIGLALPVAKEPAIAIQQLTIAAGAAQSAAFDSATRFVRLHADANCRVLFGPNPTASATSARLLAGATEFFGVQPGTKVSVIQST